MKRSMTWTTIGSIISEEVGAAVIIRGVRDEELPQSDGLLNGEVEYQPPETLISDPEPDTAILKGLRHD